MLSESNYVHRKFHVVTDSGLTPITVHTHWPREDEKRDAITANGPRVDIVLRGGVAFHG